jgi:hypothetical protein
VLRRRRRGLLSPASLIRTRAITHGVIGGGRGWQIIAAVIFGRRFLQRTFGRTPETLTIDTLKPGQSMTITTMPVGKRGRRSRQP